LILKKIRTKNSDEEIKSILAISRKLYYLGFGGVGVCVLLGVLFAVLRFNLFNLIPPCYFFAETGYYCFGCGGTRAILELLQGNIIKSLHYNIIVIYLGFIYVYYMISHSLNIITYGRIPAMLFRPVYGYIAIILTILQCVLKNFIAYKFGLWM
jgi:hypothetical protein